MLNENAQDASMSKGSALQEFAKWAIQEGAFQAADLDGLSIQEKAHELGLIIGATYDPEIHGPSDSAEKGELWFAFSAAFSAASALTAGEREPVAWRWKPKGHVMWTYNPDPEWMAAQSRDEIDAEQLYTSPPASDLDALRKRVAELKRAGAPMATILYNCASHATLPDGTRKIMHEAREAWDDAARRVREGGKIDG